MVLQRTQTALQDEIRAALADLAPHAECLEREQLAFCGKSYGTNPEDNEIEADPENWRQTFIRNLLSETGGGTPQCVIEARGQEWPAGRAYMLENAVNQLPLENRLEDFVHRTIIDFAFRSARAVCTLNRVGKRLVPGVEQLAFTDFLSDSTVLGRDRARWHAHRVSRDIDDLIDEAKADPKLGWNVAALEKIKLGLANDPKLRSKGRATIERKELVYWSMWERDYDTGDPEQGYFGTIHYVVDPQIATNSRLGQTLVRKSEAWFGHHDGPYAFAAAFKVGELPIELAPLVAGAVQGTWLNDLARAVNQGIIDLKINGVVNGDTEAAIIRAAKHGQILTLPAGTDIRAMFGQVASGGITAEMLTGFQLAMESAQRALGIYGRQGDVKENTTATAINEAQAGYASTMSLYTTAYRGFLRQIFERWAWWYDMHPECRTQVEVPPEIHTQLVQSGAIDPRSGPNVYLEGGDGNPSHHRRLALSIDAFSTRPKDELTLARDMQMAMMSSQFLAGLGPAALAYDVDGHQRALARATGAKWMERLWDANALRAIAVAMMGVQGEAPAPQPTATPKQSLTFDQPKGASRPASMGSNKIQAPQLQSAGGGAS